jgi:hypothetical protein
MQEAPGMVDLREVRQDVGKFSDHHIVAGCVVAGDTKDLWPRSKSNFSCTAVMILTLSVIPNSFRMFAKLAAKL